MNILCYGDSNTWGTPPRHDFGDVPRYGEDVRWGSVLRATLGAGHSVIEEGLGGRTTVWDDPVEGEHRNGRRYLLPCLLSHRPLDLVILLLGTNDLKHRFGLSAADIAAGAGALVDVIRTSGAGRAAGAPAVLLVSPPPLGRLDLFATMFDGAAAKSQGLAREYQAVARERRCAFFDAGQVIRSSDTDGIHFDVEAQQALGRALARRVLELAAGAARVTGHPARVAGRPYTL